MKKNITIGKRIIVGIVLICLFLATPLSSALQIDKGTTFGCDNSQVIYHMANDFNFSDIYVYPACLYMESGNITTYPSSGWLNMSMENLTTTSIINFTNNVSAANITIQNGFANFSITNGTYYALRWQANDTSAQTVEAASSEIAFGSAVPASSWYIQGNAAPTTSTLQTEGATNPTQITDFTPDFTWSYSDGEGDAQSHWQIYVGTSLGGSNKWDSGALSGTDTSDVYAGSALSRGTTYYVQVRTKDSYDWSAWATGTFKVNSLPTVSNVTVAPSSPLTTDDLTVTNDTCADADGDSVTVIYQWYVDGVHNSTFNNETTIDSANTTNGEIWKCGVIPNDGLENGTEQFSNEVEIGSGNTAPTTPTGLAPTTRQIGNSVNLTWNISTDAQGDPITYWWYVEENTETFSSPYFNDSSGTHNYSGTFATTDNATYYFRVKACDASLCSGFSTTVNFTENSAPTAPGLNTPANDTWLMDTTPTLKSNITSDTEGDSLTYYFYLDVTDATTYVGANASGRNFTTATLTENTTYFWRVRAWDGYENSTYSSIRQFKADATAPTITNTGVTPTTFTQGGNATITCDVADAIQSVHAVTVRIERPDGEFANYTMSLDTGTTYKYVYTTSQLGNHYIRYFYAWDVINGEAGNLKNASSSLTFTTTTTGNSGGTSGGGGGGGGDIIVLNETTIELFKEPIHLYEKLLQRFFFYAPFSGLEQDRLIPFAGADKELESCLSSEGECMIDPVDPHIFHVVYTQDSDDFFFKRKIINITVFDTDDYANYARLDIFIINLGAYMPIRPSKVGEKPHQQLNMFFKFKDDFEGVTWITGIRVWWLVLVGLAVVIGGFSRINVKKKRVNDWF